MVGDPRFGGATSFQDFLSERRDFLGLPRELQFPSGYVPRLGREQQDFVNYNQNNAGFFQGHPSTNPQTLAPYIAGAPASPFAGYGIPPAPNTANSSAPVTPKGGSPPPQHFMQWNTGLRPMTPGAAPVAPPANQGMFSAPGVFNGQWSPSAGVVQRAFGPTNLAR